MTTDRSKGVRLAALTAAQSELQSRLVDRAGLVGSMVGVKLKRGQPTTTLGITFLVRRKVPSAELKPSARIPKRMKIGNETFSTDVIEWPAMTEQNLTHASIINDARTQGTLTCFARSPFGVYGLSCAHCLRGADGNPATPTPVAMYSPDVGRYLRAGDSLLAVYAAGPGLPGNFGYLDCGLFTLRDPSLMARANSAMPLAVVDDIRKLMNTRLVARSALDVQGFADRRRDAQVIGVNLDALDERCDVVLLASMPGTFQGDSGMLWRTSDGRAAAIHARGEVVPPGNGSRLVTAMSAHRASAALSVSLSVA